MTGMRLCPQSWPRSPAGPIPNAGTAVAPARSNAPATTATPSRNPARPPAPATPDQRPSTSGHYRPRRHPTPRQTPRRVRTHQPLPDTNPASTKERSNKCPAVTLGHQPNVTSPARHPPAHHTTPADATAHQTRHRPAAQHHDQLKLRGIVALRTRKGTLCRQSYWK